MKTHKLLIVGAAFVLMLSYDTNSVSFSEENQTMFYQSTSTDTIERTSRDNLLTIPTKESENKETHRKPYS